MKRQKCRTHGFNVNTVLCGLSNPDRPDHSSIRPDQSPDRQGKSDEAYP
ncbi:MAG: hypothetical protein MUC50_22630 [Myxococcota bacterium]|nr:hypothetical protein [Myxococcota bacterium]